MDFRIQTRPGTQRIARAAFDFARKNGKKNVTVVTKANIVKLSDGNFVKEVREVGKDYPEIEIQERLVDAMSAKLMDPEFNKGMEVILLPNLYGDIVTDIAAEQQGGLGTASSSNLGNRYALFEAIHGTAHLSCRTWKRKVCRSLLPYSGGGHAHGTYRLRRQKKETGSGSGYLYGKGEKNGDNDDADGASTAEFTDYLLETLNK